MADSRRAETPPLPAGFIDQPQNASKVADTHRYFSEVRASLANARDALRDAEARYVAEIDGDEYAASLRVDLTRAHDALGGLQRDVEAECLKSHPSKQRLREAIDRSDLARGRL